jgi:pimeloyl-ACP methyl ester carboxylesterase
LTIRSRWWQPRYLVGSVSDSPQHTPKRLRMLILADAQGLSPLRPPPGFLIWTTINRLRSSRTTARRLVRYLIHDQQTVRRLHGHSWDQFLSYMVTQASRAEVRAAMGGYATRAIAQPVPEPLLEGLRVPVGLLWGRHDQHFPVSVAEDANSRFGWPSEVIDDAGHLPYLEQPSRFIDAVNSLADHA